MAAPGVVTCRAYARIGLLGNPSDGYYGRTIGLSLEVRARVRAAEPSRCRGRISSPS